jgi:hypothetical protein
LAAACRLSLAALAVLWALGANYVPRSWDILTKANFTFDEHQQKKHKIEKQRKW